MGNCLRFCIPFNNEHDDTARLNEGSGNRRRSNESSSHFHSSEERRRHRNIHPVSDVHKVDT